MIEIIPSEWMRKYLKDRREFTDAEKATMIWNSPIATWKEKLDSLEELSMVSSDANLNAQITDRIVYEKRAYSRLLNNSQNAFIYVVLDDQGFPDGYFNDYVLAHQYGINQSREYDYRCFSIHKQLPYSEKEKGKITSSWSSKRMPISMSVYESKEYHGLENACVRYNSNGEILSIYSNEMTEEENDRVDEFNRRRFELPFFKIPCGLEEGTVVKIIPDNILAVVDSGEESWNDYMERTDGNPEYYDFSDIQKVVFVLQEDGHWWHEHINPMYLEPISEMEDVRTEKDKLHLEALWALGAYFKEETEENNIKALDACRKYAVECAKNGRCVYTAKSIDDLLG